jgi:hypothetical protein
MKWGDERPRLQLDRGCEGRVNLAFGTSMQDMELQPELAGRIVHVF